MTEINSSPVRK